MNFSELHDFEYLFHDILNFENKLLLKIDGEFATANVVYYDEDGIPGYLRSDFEGKYLDKLGYYNSSRRFIELQSEFEEKHFDPFKLINPTWKTQPELSLLVVERFIKNRKTEPFNDQQFLHNVKFHNSHQEYSHFLVDDKTEFEVVGLID